MKQYTVYKDVKGNYVATSVNGAIVETVRLIHVNQVDDSVECRFRAYEIAENHFNPKEHNDGT